MLNKRLEEVFSKLGIPYDEGYVFCLAVHYGFHDFLIKKNFVDPDKCMLLMDVTDEGYVLKYPLFSKVLDSKRFTEFMGLLLESRLINGMGHVNNPQDYAVIETSDLCKSAFEELGEVDIEKAVEVTIEYYMNAKPALKLTKYFKNQFAVDYAAY